MSIEQIGIVVAAAGVALWPQLKSVVAYLAGLARQKPLAGPVAAVGYETAIHDLAVVRARLAATGTLGDDVKKAIDVLTLALVAGSDK